MRPPTRLLCGLALAVASAGVCAQSYPNRPIHLVVGFAPGGAADTVARAMSEAMGKQLGQAVIIDNKPGAGSSLAAEFVAKSPPDGYNVLIASPSSISVNPALSPKLGYKFSDLDPVLKITTSPLVIAVYPDSGIKSIKELVAAAKKAPGSINYATSGNGSAPHLSSVLFARLAGVDVVHVPFKGGSPAVQSVIAGDTQFTFGTSPSVLPLVRAGRLKALAITTRARSALEPELPGMAEAGLPDYDMNFWYGFFVPAGTPPAVAKKIFDATLTALQDPAVKAAYAREGTEAVASRSSEEFAAFLVEDAKFWVRLVKESGATVD